MVAQERLQRQKALQAMSKGGPHQLDTLRRIGAALLAGNAGQTVESEQAELEINEP